MRARTHIQALMRQGRYSLCPLDLDFTQEGLFDPRITFTRSSGGGRFNAAGEFEWLGTDEPRIDYDPVTGECLGLLIEEQRTNQLACYAAPTNLAGVTKHGGSDPAAVLSVVDDSASLAEAGLLSITGGNCYKLDNSAGSSHATVVFSGTFDSNNNHALKAYARGNGTITIRTGFLGIPDIGSLQDSYGVFETNTSEKTAGAPNVNDPMWIRVSAGGTVFLCLPQAEQGDYPTSYIPTAGSQVTRAPDIALISGTSFSDWFNQSKGTFFVEYQVSHLTTGSAIRQLIRSNNSGSGYWRLRNSSTATGLQSLNSSGVLTVNLVSSAYNPVPNQPSKIAFVMQENNTVICANGLISARDASSEFITTSDIRIGSSGFSEYLNGHIRKLRYFRQPLSDAQLQALTS